MDLERALGVWTTTDPGLRRNPYDAYSVLRRHAPVHKVKPMKEDSPVWYVVGYEEARQVLTDSRFTRDVTKLPPNRQPVEPLAAVGLHPSMLTVDPPEHTRLRRLVTAAFTPRRVEELRPRIRTIANQLLDEVAEREAVDLIEVYAHPLPTTVICELLGIPVEDQGVFRGWIHDLFRGKGDPAAVRAANNALRSYLAELLETKRTRPDDGLVSGLVAARDQGDHLTDAQLLSTVTLLLVAGHETTVNLIAASVIAILRHSAQRAALSSDGTVLEHVVEELLRYDPPVETAGARWALEDITVGGVRIPAGGAAMVVLAAANRDPKCVDEPHLLDVSRGPSAHLAFGHGVHYCLGASLARLEGQIALSVLFERHPQLCLAVPEDDLQLAPTLSLRSLRALPVLLNGLGAE